MSVLSSVDVSIDQRHQILISLSLRQYRNSTTRPCCFCPVTICAATYCASGDNGDIERPATLAHRQA